MFADMNFLARVEICEFEAVSAKKRGVESFLIVS